MRPVKFTLGAMLGNDVIDQLVRDLVSAVLELIDLGRYERLVGQLAQLHMPWRVHGDHRRFFGQRVIFAQQRRPELGGTERASVLRSEEHTSELQSLMRISYAVFCLKKKKERNTQSNSTNNLTPSDCPPRQSTLK